MDLIVWPDADGGLAGFELCYGKSRTERAYAWRRGGAGDREKVLADFLARAARLERPIVDGVSAVLRVGRL